jgi:hypothetical protein
MRSSVGTRSRSARSVGCTTTTSGSRPEADGQLVYTALEPPATCVQLVPRAPPSHLPALHNRLLKRPRPAPARACRAADPGRSHKPADEVLGTHRYKHPIADRLCAKHLEAQQREALIVVNVLNRMTALGMPESVKVSA